MGSLREPTLRLPVRYIDELRNAMRKARQHRPFHIDAWVVLPDYLHCVWTLRDGGADYSARRQAIKAGFSRQIPFGEPRSASRVSKHQLGLWQPRFWEHTIRDEDDYQAHYNYIHFNTVKYGLVNTPAEWPYSTFHRTSHNP